MFTFCAVFVLTCLCASMLLGQQSLSFEVEGKPVQVHAFASQAFTISNDNNYLTMPTSSGSFAFTDFGGNISVQLTGNLRVAAQFYDRNLGQLGRWNPKLDWALVDYKFKDWFGVRAGSVKTTLGLYTDTQDLEFLHTWAILPQSMYPLDLRSSNDVHDGVDLYGDIGLKRLGSLSYTAYTGFIPDDPTGGYAYGSAAYGNKLATLGARDEGGDVRWHTPIQGLLAGVSYLDAANHDKGTDYLGRPYSDISRKDETSQFYAQYTAGRLKLDSEYRRVYLDLFAVQIGGAPRYITDSRSAYASASYRISKRLELGAYYSVFFENWADKLSDPGNHIYDKAVTARIDLTSHWDLKIEGHFMNGYGSTDSFRGFYLQDNPQGFKPDTNLLIIRTGIEF